MKSKRILFLVLAMIMVLGTFGTVFADVAETSNEKIDWLVQEGMVHGNETGDLMLDKEIDRASTAKMIAVALDAETEAQGMKGINSGFKDMSVGHWANGYVNYAAGKSLVKGDENGNFMPSKDITYGEVTTILVRLVLKRDLTAEEKGSAGSWVAPYVAKATELNLFDGVSIPDFGAKAIRKDVLEMFYNAMINKEAGNYSVIKAIVLENNRVERIGSNEVVVEVIKEIQRANYADASRKTVEKGDQERYVIDAKKAGTAEADVENLLGKVADFTINKAGEIVGVKLDETHKYLEGPVVATKGKLSVNGTSYTVELDERYRGSDERIFRTYHNDDAFTYEDFYRNTGKADYARVTVKNGKVLFVDAYTFDDIAPVQDVKRDAKDIYVYNDERDARIEKFEPATIVVGYNDGKLARIAREDIKVNDVVHVYKKNRMIVRQDAMVTGEYEKVERNRDNKYFAHVDGKGYLINTAAYRKPVFAHDSKAYTTLVARDAQDELRHFFKEKVTILKDINGDLQLFGAEIEYNEGMALVQQILARGQGKFITKSDDRITLDEDYSSNISIHNLKSGVTTTNQRLNSFDTKDLVFVLGNKDDKIERLARIATEKEMEDAAKALKSTTKADMNNDFIRMSNDFRYQVLDRTNVFVINNKGVPAATTVAKLQDQLNTEEVEAFVLSDKYVSELVDVNGNKVVVDRNRITTEDNVAHTIVFMNADYSAKTNAETALVTNVYTARNPHYVVGHGPDNNGKVLIDRTARAGLSLTGMKTDDIVSLKLSDNDDKLVNDYTVLIPASDVKTESYKVIGGQIGAGYSRFEYRRLELADAKGARITKWLVRGVEEFGTITVDSVVTFHEDKNNDIDVIRVYGKNTPVTKNAPVLTGFPKLVRAYQFKGDQVILAINTLNANGTIKTTEYEYVGAQTLAELIALQDETVDFVDFELAGKPVINAIWKSTETPEEPGEPGDGEEKVKATATTQVALGATKVVITLDGAVATEVDKVLVNGSEVTIQRAENNEVTILSAVEVEKVEIVVAGETYQVTITK